MACRSTSLDVTSGDKLVAATDNDDDLSLGAEGRSVWSNMAGETGSLSFFMVMSCIHSCIVIFDCCSYNHCFLCHPV